MALDPEKIRLQELAHKYLKGTLSPSEQLEFDEWFRNEGIENIKVNENIAASEEKHRQLILARITEEIQATHIHKVKRLWPRTAAAASILLLLSAGGYFLLHKQEPQLTAQNQIHDILPGKEQATLILANGQKILLSKGMNGKLAQQGNMQIAVNYNKLAYTATTAAPPDTKVEYNTLSTSRGQALPYPLLLADGTKVWLNAASSITFPTAFTGDHRDVKITGEVLIEVAHNARQPFRVRARDQVIEDIGTRFNINAYDDEPVLKTTLITGSVKISAAQNSLVLKPGEQAQNSNHILKVQKVDTDGIIAWKNSYFSFDDNNLESIMRQVSRWYNVDVVYKNESTKTKMITGTISRYKNVSSILRKLEITGAAHFRIDGKQIIVTE